MAKSLRSKRKRKIRAEKRVVNAKKELVKLKEIATKLHGSKEAMEATIPDIHVVDNEELAMEIDSEQSSKKAKKAAMRINNQWMNQRKIKAIKNKIKRHNKKKARQPSSAGLSSRKAKR